jgi:NitT/TauT family transport system ATP-binding protein
MTTRPGRVKEVVEVPYPRDERGEQFLETPDFAELRHHLWTSLAEEQASPAR